MNEKIETLLAELNSTFIRLLPCYLSDSGISIFLIGSLNGPAIELIKESTQLASLKIVNSTHREINYPMNIPSQHYSACESIFSRIKHLKIAPAYQEVIKQESELEKMIDNVEKLIAPLFR